MKIKICYRKNLKMSAGKLAAVCTHIGKELGRRRCCCFESYDPTKDVDTVLMASDSAFNRWKALCRDNNYTYHIHVDNGMTEVDTYTECAIGWIVED